jgi:hypothetical protein
MKKKKKEKESEKIGRKHRERRGSNTNVVEKRTGRR